MMASGSVLARFIQLLHALWFLITQVTLLKLLRSKSSRSLKQKHNFSELPIVGPPPPSPADTLRSGFLPLSSSHLSDRTLWEGQLDSFR